MRPVALHVARQQQGGFRLLEQKVVFPQLLLTRDATTDTRERCLVMTLSAKADTQSGEKALTEKARSRRRTDRQKQQSAQQTNLLLSRDARRLRRIRGGASQRVVVTFQLSAQSQ